MSKKLLYSLSKKVICLLLAFCVSIVPAAATGLLIMPAPNTDMWDNPFKDVSQDDWFYDAVEYSFRNDLMHGKTETEFSPYHVTTRGQIITILWRMETSPVVNHILPFEDVPQESYCAEAIRWAACQGIASGYDDGTFHPDAPISRQQLASFLWRYAKYKNMDVSVGEDTNILSYNDAFDISEYAIPALQWACGAGIMSGYTDGYLRPFGQASRAHTAQTLMNFMEIG